MFQREPKLSCLDIVASRVLRLQRSVTEVQVALPGQPPEKAQAYVCAFYAEKGARIAIVLHCLWSSRLAFYLNDEGEIGQQDCAHIFDDGLSFAESMGFLMADTDIHLLDENGRFALWNALPLKAGVAPVIVEPEAELLDEETEVVDAGDEEPEVIEPEDEATAGPESTAGAELSPEVVYPVGGQTAQSVEAEEKLAEQKLAEQKLAEQKLAEQKLAEQKLAEQKLAEQKLAEQKLAEQKLAEQKPLEELGRLLASF